MNQIKEMILIETDVPNEPGNYDIFIVYVKESKLNKFFTFLFSLFKRV